MHTYKLHPIIVIFSLELKVPCCCKYKELQNLFPNLSPTWQADFILNSHTVETWPVSQRV